FFFFSSRRRHTRSYGDWSSDVCSSDLFDKIAADGAAGTKAATRQFALLQTGRRFGNGLDNTRQTDPRRLLSDGLAKAVRANLARSEERRVGKECRYRMATNR